MELLTFNLYVEATVGTFTYTSSRGKTFTTIAKNNLHIEFIGLTGGASTGSRVSSGTIDPNGARGRFRVTGDEHCYILCGAVNVPQSTVVPLLPKRFTAPLPTLTGAVGQPQTVQGTAYGVEFTVEPHVSGAVPLHVTGTTQVFDRKIRRTAVPEPSTFTLLSAGLAAAGFVGAVWRRWRACNA